MLGSKPLRLSSIRERVRRGLRGHPERAAHAEDFLTAVHGHSFAEHSDGELKAALHGPKTSVATGGGEVFALVFEAISRRLGAWRLFDSHAAKGAFANYQKLADRILLAAPYRSNLAFYTDEAFIDGPLFAESLGTLIDEMGLDRDGRTIVQTMVYVAEKSKYEYWSQIELPTRFYRAIADKDTSRDLELRPTDEQILAGRFLYEGKVVEMNAGEGKTIAAAFPAAMHAIMGRSVHVITANDYLASRDAEWLAPVYESLGISVGAILGHMSEAEKRDAYGRQVVYGTVREFGFDFLRDNLKHSKDERVQRPLDVAIVDEADHALIDEARMPLIIAGGSSGGRRSIHRVRRVVERLVELQKQQIAEIEDQLRASSHSREGLKMLLARLVLADPDRAVLAQRFAAAPGLQRRVQAVADASMTDEVDNEVRQGLYYFVDARCMAVSPTELGQAYIERHLGPMFDTSALERELERIEASYDLALEERRIESGRLRKRLLRQHNQMNQVHQMLWACILLKRDVDYIVSDGEVVLIDGLTGRARPDNRYQHGLQAALEAKEGVAVRSEPEVLAQISVQGLMRQYSSLAGMTGTALSAADELLYAYGLEVVAVPPTRPPKRTDLPTRLYASRRDKLETVVDEVDFCRRVGRPVLVGTLTVEQSEQLSSLLGAHGIEHRLLNAVNSADEAEVVRSAGGFGAVTVATNMAGRGTDIIVEPDLDRRVIDRYVTMVHHLLSTDVRSVMLACSTSEEAALMRSALSGEERISVTGPELDGQGYAVMAERAGGGSDGRTVCLEFGLGLYVIGTEMNESRRVDAQLRGRCGRQGEFGSSRFILSLEDGPLVQLPERFTLETKEKKRDASGREAFEGMGLTRLLEQAQELAERDDEAHRARLLDYTRVLERLTLSYYAARSKLIDADCVDDLYAGMAEGTARRLVAEHLPLSGPREYASGFDRMAEALWADCGVNCAGLWGLGASAFEGGLARLLRSRLEETRGRFGDREFTDIAKLVILQTGDDLWREYISHAQEAMISSMMCGWSHGGAVADFLFQSLTAFEAFVEDVEGMALPRLLQLPPPHEPVSPDVSTVEDIEAILV